MNERNTILTTQALFQCHKGHVIVSSSSVEKAQDPRLWERWIECSDDDERVRMGPRSTEIEIEVFLAHGTEIHLSYFLASLLLAITIIDTLPIKRAEFPVFNHQRVSRAIDVGEPVREFVG